jgi:hypothetical protein
MSKLAKLSCAGLMTDMSPLAAPEGALRIADDVIIDRPGVASARPGFDIYATKSTDYRPRSMHAWARASGLLIASRDATTWRMENASTTVSGEAEPLDVTVSCPQFVEARKNLYWSSKKGPHKLTDSADTTGTLAGWHDAPGGLVGNGTTPGAIANGEAVALRWCFVRRDVNGVETRSMPSPWLRFDATGASYDPSVTVVLPSAAIAGDQVEVYRSKAVLAASTPSDHLYLASVYTLVTADITAGFVAINVDRTESALGAELYTNATREGLLKGNGRPPACHALALWADCTWFGGTRGPYGGQFSITAITGLTINDGLAGLQRLRRTGNITNGSPTITGIAATASVKVGQLITDGTPGTAPAGFPTGATVLSKTATTITMTANATATTAAINFYVHDGITVDGTTIWASSANKATSPYGFAIDSGGVAVTTSVAAVNFAYVFSLVSSSTYALGLSDPYEPSSGSFGSVGTVFVRSVDLDDALWAMSFIASSSAITYSLSSTGIPLVERDDWPNAIYYSKPDEPEHVPPLNYLRVGSEVEPVYALAALPAALLAFKRDGIYRITGSAPDGWRVDQISAEQIVRGECVSVLGDRAYAWCLRGLYECTAGSVANVSEGAIGRSIVPSGQHAIDQDLLGPFVCGWPSANVVLVGVPEIADPTGQADELFCFCVSTRAWSRWSFEAWCMAYHLHDQTLRFARGGERWELRESRDTWADPGCDEIHTLSGWTYTAPSTSISISTAQLGVWTPKAGDWVKCEINNNVTIFNEYRRVIAAVDAGVNGYILTIDAAFSAGTQSVFRGYEGIRARLQWMGISALAGQTINARAIHALFDWTDYDVAGLGVVGGTGTRVLVGGQTDVTATITTTVASTYTRDAKTEDIRVAPGRAIARSSHLMPYVELSELGLPWRCLGVVIDAEAVSERVNR